MELWEVIRGRRSIRKFLQESIDYDILAKITRAGWYGPSAGNNQPVRYIIVDDEERVKSLFQFMGWLGGTPSHDEMPVAYIVIIMSRSHKGRWSREADCAAAIQNILLAAHAEGLGACWIGKNDNPGIAEVVELPDDFYVYSAIALGYPAETSTLFENNETRSIHRDDAGDVHVPRMPFDEVIHRNRW